MDIVFELRIVDTMDDEEYFKMIKSKGVFNKIDEYTENVKRSIEETGLRVEKIDLTK